MEKIKTKVCSKCKEEKPIEQHFNKDKNKPDGYSTICKECNNSRYNNICEHCGKGFKSRYKKTRFCSIDCNNKSRCVDKTKVCPVCNEKFTYKNIKQECCSRECARKLKHPPIYVNCEICKKEVRKTQRQINTNKHIYCSQECKIEGDRIFYRGENSSGWKGRSYVGNCANCGEEIVVKMYLPRKNYYCSQGCKNEHQKILNLGENNPRYNSIEYNCDYCGKSMYKKQSYANSKEHVFCGRECLYNWQSVNMCGENNHNYKKDISMEDRERGRNFEGYYFWRRSVFKRDNYTCQCCGDKTGSNLNAHHLNGYNWYKKGRIDVRNGVSLCFNCHSEFHSIYGKGDNTILQFFQFMASKQINTLFDGLITINENWIKELDL